MDVSIALPLMVLQQKCLAQGDAQQGNASSSDEERHVREIVLVC